MILNPVGSTATTANTSGKSTSAATDPNAVQDRFLKLLVAQLNNQDPMNPLDNAQMTSQMAQINTVTGIQTLNLTMQTMAEQFSTMQTLQGTQMIGRSVLAEGDKLSTSDGVSKGQFELAGTATDTRVEIVTPGGVVVGTVEMGAQDKGRHDFSWDSSKYAGNTSDLKFRVVATTKDGAVESTPLVTSRVTGTGSANGALTLTLDSGATVNYGQIRAVL
ncbi:flagellar hook assembly protein FlgD [Acidovorax sp. Leaf160]|uniref:flagellar hook assembly protein FlgD n=1 Tax=Acidovorax sp. Leaf160 TaxID=1736280 RepID=UPI0006F4E11A|nr:flagellar hook capping FlgD N-terminal domain-containing protein [Acidovorax sp. Leaf160]KQR62157.1 flagellar biosynthesis protein FlgD [Acidovorax sp. Leaf160]